MLSRGAALCLLILLSPALLVVCVLVAVFMGRPVFFRQERTGLLGAPFRIVKFRTMRVARGDDEGDAHRLTRMGDLLRKTSIDELPSLWNVVRGDMRLIGPRPLLVEYLDHYSPFERRRLEVKPGLTGWAQINGRNSLSWGEKFELDVWYVDHRSWLLDSKILLRTFKVVVQSSGISHGGHATMPKLTATDD